MNIIEVGFAKQHSAAAKQTDFHIFKDTLDNQPA